MSPAVSECVCMSVCVCERVYECVSKSILRNLPLTSWYRNYVPASHSQVWNMTAATASGAEALAPEASYTTSSLCPLVSAVLS